MKNAGALFIAGGVVLLGGLFYAFKPQPAAPMPIPATPAPGVAAPAAAAAPAPREFTLVVRKGRLAEGSPDTLSVTQGDEVVIRIDTDTADELHLHGYDLHADLKPGTPAELRFRADRSGRFEYELHKAHGDLGALEVQPR